MIYRLLVIASLASLLVASRVGAEEPGEPADLAVYRLPIAVEHLSELRQTFDVWSYKSATDSESIGEAIVLLDAAEVDTLRSAGWAPTIDVEQTEAHLTPRRETKGGAGGISGFSCYRTVEETHAALAAAAVARPDLATWSDLGDSWEKANLSTGYDVHLLVLTNSAIAGPKPKLVVIAAMHAREYSTAELATRFALHLVDRYGVDPEVTWLLDHREIHVVAQMNPDGRKRAEGGQFWRKNANNNHCTDSANRGVDLNRNASFLWGAASTAGCSEVFRGPSAGSEPETRAVEDHLVAIFPDRKGDIASAAPDDTEGLVFSIHSFGELVLYPWEAMSGNSPNHAQLRTLGRKLAFFDGYTACQDCLGTAAGTTVDFAYGELGVAAYTLELGNSFFEPCANFESTIWPDHLPFLLYSAKAARRPYIAPAGPAAIDVALSATEVMAGDPVTVTATLDDTRHAAPGPDNEVAETAGPITAGWVSIGEPADSDSAVLIGMAAVDGVFDGTTEAVSLTLDTSSLTTGRHLVYVLGEDSGARGVPTAVFLDVTDSPAIFFDGFESGMTTQWSSSTH